MKNLLYNRFVIGLALAVTAVAQALATRPYLETRVTTPDPTDSVMLDRAGYTSSILANYFQTTANLSTDGTMGSASLTLYPSQSAVIAYVASHTPTGVATVSGSPVSGNIPGFTSGTNLAPITGTVNQFLATPTSGSGNATLRSIAASDLPAWSGPNYIMVQTVNAGQSPTIQAIQVTNPGLYSTTPTATCTASPNTYTPTLTVNTSGTTPNIIVTGVTWTANVGGPSNYTVPPTVTFSGTHTVASAARTLLSLDQINNGTALINAVAAAYAQTTANGYALGAQNPINVLLPPGIYDLNGSTLTIPVSYINLIGWEGKTKAGTGTATSIPIIESNISAASSAVVSYTGASVRFNNKNIFFYNYSTAVSANTTITGTNASASSTAGKL